MEFMKKVTQRLLRVRRIGRMLRDEGLINTTDLLVATAGTVVLSAAIGGAAISTLNESKYGKAQPDATTIAQAITSFYKDTGKWPGQAEHAVAPNTVLFLATGGVGAVFPAVGEGVGFDLPEVAGFGLKTTNPTTTVDNSVENVGCADNSLEGFVSETNVGSFASSDAADQITGATILNLNDFLVRKPSDEDAYPSWKGPYLQEIATDPWQRAWVAFLAPLYCSEDLGDSDASGQLGYAWLLSGGSNNTITTEATDFTLDPDGDDTGVVLGKLRTRAAPVSN